MARLTWSHLWAVATHSAIAKALMGCMLYRPALGIHCVFFGQNLSTIKRLIKGSKDADFCQKNKDTAP